MLKRSVANAVKSLGASYILLWMLLAFITVGVLMVTPAILYSSSTAVAIIVGLGFLTVLYAVLDSRKHAMRVANLTWAYMLVSQEILHPLSDPDQVQRAASFDPSSYSEPIVWIFAFIVLGVLTIARPRYVTQIFSGGYRWAVFLTAWSVFAVVYSPNITYALAWAAKLVLITLLLKFQLTEMNDTEDLRSFMATTFWAYLVLTLVPLIRAIADPATLFQGAGGRLNANPSELSATAGAFLLLGLILYAVKGRKLYAVGAFLGGTIMIAALGKAGIAAGVFSAAAFYALRRKYKASLAIVSVLVLSGAVLFVAGGWFSHYVLAYKGASTITGRTSIWGKALPEALAPPRVVIGHGYVASKFVATEIPGEMVVDHLHNAYLDTLFNIGLIGLSLLLIFQYVCGRNLYRAWRYSRLLRTHNGRDMYILVTGSMALVIDLFINGMLNATYGGRMKSPYMLLVALLMISEFALFKTVQLLGARPKTNSVVVSPGPAAPVGPQHN